MLPLHGRVQHYDWGDLTSIPHLLGLPPDGRPWAEWWWGTHHGAASEVSTSTGRRPLTDVTGGLPFLVKLLAAARPLSLQLHPNAEQAVEGFARENAAGLALDDPRRTYRDPLPKPELLCALTEFEALCGIQPEERTLALLAELGPVAGDLHRRVADGGAMGALRWLLVDRPDLSALLEVAARVPDPRCHWAALLGKLHPGDPASAASLLLNHVVLQPGEAIFLDAGNLHAYLRGTGLEVMAASDNVVRCGWTSKHVDVDAVLSLLDPTPLADPVLHPSVDGAARSYRSPGAPFHLWSYALTDDLNDGLKNRLTVTANDHEVWWCSAGDAGPLATGQAGLLTARATADLHGPATLYRISS